MGLWAAPLTVGASVLAGEPFDTRSAERATVPATVSIAGNTMRDAAGAANGMMRGDLDPLAKVMLKDVLPMINLSGTGMEGLLGPPAYNYLIKDPNR